MLTGSRLDFKMFCTKRQMSSRQKKLLASCPNVLTPDCIPKFFIPPRVAASPERLSKLIPALEITGLLGKNTASFPSSYKALIKSANRHIIEVEHVDEEFSDREDECAKRLSGGCFMPHLAGSASFACLPEIPHTRRRESLFHARTPSPDPCVSRGQKPFGSVSPLEQHSFPSLRIHAPDLHPLSYPFSSPYSSRSIDGDPTSSTESSPFHSPSLSRSLAGTLDCQTYTTQRLFYRTLHVKPLTRAGSLSGGETSSTDNSPNILRRGNEDQGLGNSGTMLALPPIFHMDFICCHERLIKENVVTLSKGGRLRLSAAYMKDIARLRVRLVSAEDLYHSNFEPKTIRCCVTLYLQPGKVQKQRSTIIKNSRNPIFNEDFFFEGVFEEELDVRSLKMKVINKGSNLWRDCALGNCELALSSIVPT